MIRASINALAALALALATFAAVSARAEGQIGTLERGIYSCEFPGDANGRAGLAQDQLGFTIATGSRYASVEGSGTYLRRGEMVKMTSGPRKGEQYQIVSEGFLRRLENGRAGSLRCVRQPGGAG